MYICTVLVYTKIFSYVILVHASIMVKYMIILYHHMFILTAPSAPLNVTAFNTSSSSVRVTWDRPGTPRGIIRDYVISYYPTDVGAGSSMSTSTGNNSEVTDLTELDIYTSYTITVAAVTITQGDPSTSVSVFTDEDGK